MVSIFRPRNDNNSSLIKRGNSSTVLFLVVLVVLQSGALVVEGPSVSKNIIPSTGVTCLALSADGKTLIAGTKTGRILVSSRTSQEAQGGPLTWEEVSSDEYGCKFPVYSLAFGEQNGGGEFLFAGAGDRFVSVWRKEKVSFNLVHTLGPHTGWVKALAYSRSTNTLYSIGCNCIESWDFSRQVDVGHISKWSIENSPSMGSTLSGDLLSLCLIEGRCLVSGGVDGRIHCWSLDFTKVKPFFSCRSHDGRVNAIVYQTTLGLIFSVGHDGVVIASKLTFGAMETVVAFKVEGTPRLSALCIVNEDQSGCKLGLGSTDGRVIVVRVTVSEQDIISIAEECRLKVDGNPMIYSVCKCPAPSNDDSSPSILVGHAKGLIEWGLIS